MELYDEDEGGCDGESEISVALVGMVVAQCGTLGGGVLLLAPDSYCGFHQ